MKRNISSLNCCSKKQKLVENAPNQDISFLSSVRCYIVPACFGLKRLEIFKRQIEKYGGSVIKSLDVTLALTHIIVEDSVDREKVEKLIDFKELCSTAVVKCSWISECLKNKSLLDESDHLIYRRLEDKPKDTKLDDRAIVSRDHISASCELALDITVSKSTSETEQLPDQSSFAVQTEESIQPATFQSKFACAHSSSSSRERVEESPNCHITEELQKLLQVYQAKNDTWRVAGYQKAIAAIHSHPTKITSYEEARQIRGVGEKLAAKVAEIAASGRLRKVEEVCGSEETAVITLFLGVWGAGPATAHAWYAQGLRSLDDVRNKASLTRHQRVGLQHYHDLNDRIPRQEVAQIHDFVRTRIQTLAWLLVPVRERGAVEILKLCGHPVFLRVKMCCDEVRSGIMTEVCGSYRRGRPSCGDVDVLITHPDGHSHAGVFTALLDNMRRKGFLTDDLVTQEDGKQQKYLGVCKLPAPLSKYRRLDIIVVPYAEFAPALLYFTGSSQFNRSMRLLATKMGMSLSEHGLHTNVVRKGSEKLTNGYLLATPTEESIFQHLGLPYRAPRERDH
ncbi:DNA polymerase beta palm domain [Trinorchestia longiramus]|nr:DNA polymerase beta palm domain [Trinorchestia longiramus]